MTKVAIPKIKLNNGQEMPALGYGTWLALNGGVDCELGACPQLVAALGWAIDAGYRHVDTAHLYRVEPEVGAVVRQKIKDGVVTREEMFITTKVWQHNHRAADAEAAVSASLRRLGLDYLDLVLMHWPMSISQQGVDEHIDFLETWRGLERAVRRGLTRAIGVSNFNEHQLRRLLEHCAVAPVCNQVEVNLNFGQESLLQFCRSRGVVLVAFSPFGTMVPARAAAGTPGPKLGDPALLAIGRKHGKTETQVTLRYLYQRGIVSIPKSVTRARILENASIFDFTLDSEDLATLAKFDNGFRTVRPLFWQDYDNYPFEKVELDEKVEIPATLLTWRNGHKQNID